MTPSILVEGAGVRFQFDRQRRPVTPAMGWFRRRTTTTWGLRGIDLTVGGGEGVALVGPNGAGKTTMLRLLAGVLAADEGRVEVRGRIGPLLSISAGLLGRLTGRENVHLLGVLAGLPPPRAREAVPGIQEASMLGAAFDRPVSSYSLGMRARLGLATILRTSPQVLLLDEVHEVLDRSFRGILEQRVAAVTARGGLLIAAGHDLPMLRRLCSRAVLLDDGRVRGDGPFEEVVEELPAQVSEDA